MIRSRSRWLALAAAAPLLGGCHRAPAWTHIIATAKPLDPAQVITYDDLLDVAVPPNSAGDALPPSAASQVVGRRARFHLDERTPMRLELLAGDELNRDSSRVQKKGRQATLPLAGAETLRANDQIDVVGTFTDPQTGEQMTMTILQRVVVLGVHAGQSPSDDRVVDLLVQPEEAEILRLSAHTGTLHASLRNPEDVGLQEERGRATIVTLLTGERIDRLLKQRLRYGLPSLGLIKGTSSIERDESSSPPHVPGPLDPTVEVLDR